MKKITSFRDIPKFPSDAGYNVNVSWKYLEAHLENWNERGKNGECYTPVITQPVFQRQLVWTDEQAVRYVEYILRGGKSSRQIQWNCSTWGGEYNTPIELVDGQQRLNAARRFLNNEFTVFGSYYKDFTDNFNICNADFIFSVNNLKTRKEVLEWYWCLNFGGTPHGEVELEKIRKLIASESK